MDHAPEAVLKKQFGHNDFRPGQKQVIDALLAGRSAAAIFPTGSGKSFCYQLPALLFPGLTLVVSPLIALMKDQIDALKKKGIAAERLDSSLGEEDYRRVMTDIRDGQLKLLFIAPERLSNERFVNILGDQRISLLAVDEAHCISAWGHNFRPDYLKLARAAVELNVERVLALTATATPQVSADIAEAFHIQADDVINTGFHRPNLDLRVSACADQERSALLVRRLKERPPGPTIVYVSLQRQAEALASYLQKAGFQAQAYHAGIKAEQRAAIQDDFMSGQVPIICATIAFGMGVDKADIRYVYHYHLAKGFESYMQEIGRAGRDGLPSVCELFACRDDMTVLENFAYGDSPDRESVFNFLTELSELAKENAAEIDIAVSELSRRHDIRQLVVNTLLTRLELAEQIRSEGYYYADIRYALDVSEAEVLAAYPERQAAFLSKVFSAGKKARKWITHDMERAVDMCQQPRDVILRALDSIQLKGLGEVQLAGYRQHYRLLNKSFNVNEWTDTLCASIQEHEALEIKRIAAMMGYAQLDTCLCAHLLQYFGEEIENCGHCGICLGDRPAVVPPQRKQSINDCDLSGFAELINENPSALARPRQQARFLCGLTSPAVSTIRGLRSNPLFGRCESVAFADVLQCCERG